MNLKCGENVGYVRNSWRHNLVMSSVKKPIISWQLCNFLWMVHMCLHVLGMTEKPWLSVKSHLDSKKLKPMKKAQGVTKTAFLQCNTLVVNPSICYEWLVKSCCTLHTSMEYYFLLGTCGIHFLYWMVNVGHSCWLKQNWQKGVMYGTPKQKF